MTHFSTPLQPAKSREFSGRSTARRSPSDSHRHYAGRRLPCTLPGHRERPRQARIRFLTEAQVEALRRAVKTTSRNAHRDATLILVAYRHGLRVSELVDLRWQDVHLELAEVYIHRLKGSKSTMQPIEGDELRALRRLRRENPTSPYLFVAERGGPLSPDAVQYMIRRAGEAAGLPMRVHPHMLRHGCGFRLTNAGANSRMVQDYLGHRDPRNTAIYTEVDATRFRGLWRRSRAAG
jgi:type 1 fimbriae regulatory protein FimB/type 1 fimbriae regulatory protein FimE